MRRQSLPHNKRKVEGGTVVKATEATYTYTLAVRLCLCWLRGKRHTASKARPDAQRGYLSKECNSLFLPLSCALAAVALRILQYA